MLNAYEHVSIDFKCSGLITCSVSIDVPHSKHSHAVDPEINADDVLIAGANAATSPNR